MAINQLKGRRFGRLTVTELACVDRKGQARWKCLCDCGNTKEVVGYSLTGGKTLSCGCFHKEQTSKANTTHGESSKAEYSIWLDMWKRCKSEDPKLAAYQARMPVDRWKDYTAFLSDMGRRPSKFHTLERVDNHKGYGPDNCIWDTRAAQASNRGYCIYVKLAGKKLTLKEACREAGLKYSTVYSRYRKGQTMESASNSKLSLHMESQWNHSS